MVPLLNDEKTSSINQRGNGKIVKLVLQSFLFSFFSFSSSTLEFKVRRSRSIVNHRPAKLDTHGIPLIYSASYCASELNPLSDHPKKRLSSLSRSLFFRLSLSLSRARGSGDRSINFTSLSNPIFSRYPRVLHDTFY